MNTSKISLFVVLALLFIGKSLQAQFIEFGVGIGKSVYWGDLNAPEFSTNLKNNGGLAYQLSARYNYKGILGIKSNLLFGKISGNDKYSSLAWQQQRNLNFSSNLVEFSIMGEYYFFGFSPGRNDFIFSPYITAGAAAFYSNPSTEYNGSTVYLQPLGTEGQGMAGYPSKYNKYNFGIPFGAGAVIKLNEKVSVSMDIIGRRTFSDYIDDVSTSYVSFDQLSSSNGILAAMLSDRTPEYFGTDDPSERSTGDQRGGSTVDDYYFTALATFMFSITDPDTATGKKKKYNSNCPKF